MLNGSSAITDNMSVAEIKDKAKEHAQKTARGASAISLIRAARFQTQVAHRCETSQDLKGALGALTKAISLLSMLMDSSEFRAEEQPGRKGVLIKEMLDFQQEREFKGISTSLISLTIHISDTSNTVEGPNRKMGTTIADRLRSLQDAGLAVSTSKESKRLSRELPNPPVTPLSPDATRSRFSAQITSPPPPLTSLIPPSAPASAVPSPHATVPLSSLGPPSPTSSDSSSPRLSHISLSEFAHTFPSISELDEMNGLSFPSVPNATGSSVSSHLSSISNSLRVDPAQPTAVKPFPVLSIDPGPRPSSTPITPITNHFISRPASPARSPVITSKASALGLSSSPLKPSIPVSNVILPKALYEYMCNPTTTVLLIDVRTREEFQKEHVKTGAVVCIEPFVLTRASIDGSSLEDSLHVAPSNERVLFVNRDKFDLVAMYDESSELYDEAHGPLSSLVRVIYEKAFRKILRNTPMLLVGGLQAWKREVGSDEVVRGVPYAHKPANGLENHLGSSPPIAPSLSSSTSTAPSSTETPRLWTSASQIPMNGTEKPTLSEPNERSRLPGVATSSPRDNTTSLVRRHALNRPNSASISYPNNSDNSTNSPSILPQSMANGTSSIQYPQFSRTMSSTTSSSSSFSSSPAPLSFVSLPPQASINPSPLSRRRSEYMDIPHSPLAALGHRPSIDYPDLPLHNILRPPPPAASPASERQDSRPRLMHAHSYSVSVPQSKAGPKPPTIQSEYPVTYWSDVQIVTSGLKNLGNTCYMNSTIQCLSATVPFARFFTDGRWKNAVNMLNPLGTKGNLALAFSNILYEMAHSELPHLTPNAFRRSICSHAPQFSGSEQHDSQEFLSFLLDGLHEDLNRVLQKPHYEVTPEREAELEKLPQQIASQQEWNLYRMRNDSLVVDYFQGQFRNRMECLTCHKTSTTYNTFMYLTLPIPIVRGSSKVSLQSCLDAFVKEEILENTDAWYVHCPNCKALRKATKRLSLSRLPPILLIHLKRFSFKGPFTDKIETVVDFPLRTLDLTNYMPPPLPPGMDKGNMNGANLSTEDPRMQTPPYKYDLYGVTNHFGTLSGGHYTAFIASRGGWVYCDDSRVTPTDAKQVVGRPAYVLYYKRVQS
ncbi:hypothetical protein SERLA73DRAFT_66796 [Serpula lacrymans var. lacrymans S7.3]|uniref:ubiquitinyl hydrolase 1 n=1 Tax=Serpula lacrymans var. lacrymans (strain S7.3) TaxID=936435 RepID=F8QIP6_SERL3|nr:hypothetical protein SERLA73DRAFT_66796 [Serpula lacrymans var. lacrymans S7.3]